MALGHKTLAFFYLQLAQNLDAGLPLAGALRGVAGPPAASLRRVAGWIEGGGSIEHALHLARSWLPEAERPLLLAGATSGRLPRVLHRLAERHAQLHKTQLNAALACVYPLVLLHLGLLIFPVLNQMISAQTSPLTIDRYLSTVAMTLIPLWGLLLWLAWLARRESPLLYRVEGWLPLFRGYSRAQALADFTFTLSNLLDAGIIIGQAWLVAGQASRSPVLQAASLKIHEVATQGEPPGLALPRFPCFPVEYVGLYRAGELNGQLDHNLRLLAEQSLDHSRLCLKLAARSYSMLVFLLIAGMVGWVAFATFAGYFKMLGGVSGPH